MIIWFLIRSMSIIPCLRSTVDNKLTAMYYFFLRLHFVSQTSTLQILGSVSEQIHISLFRNLVFSIPDLIARPLTE